MSILKSRRALRTAALASTLFIALGAASADARPRTYNFDIAQVSLSEALRTYARITGQQIIFTDDLVAGRTAPLLRGAYSADEALAVLLANSGLRVERAPSGSIMVRATARAAALGSSGGGGFQRVAEAQGAEPGAAATADTEQPKEGSGTVEKVTVTGSRIRGARQASPVVTITSKDMRNQGHTDLGQVARALPQSYGGGQNPGVSGGAGGIGNQNITGSSSLNLRGLGQDGTLTLLNGNRLPYDGFTQATDLAMVPIAAIDRMEILLDGASAIYGSDAVGGVANIVLKRDYDGVEVSARYGEATSGGYEQQQYTAVGGTYWSTGGFIVTADYNDNEGITASQRDYLKTLPPATSVYPPSEQKGVLFSGYQRFGGFAELAVDAFYTERAGKEFINWSIAAGYDINVARDLTVWGVAPSLRFDLPGDWSVRLHGALGQSQGEIRQVGVLPSGAVIFDSLNCSCNEAESIGLESEGPLFDLPGGEARVAFGGGYRGNVYNDINRLTGRHGGGDDNSHYVYGEIYLPLISAEQDIPLIHKLSLEGAVRYEDYKSFGNTTTPKVGVIWGISPDVDLKATWGKSFKVPTLLQQHQRMTMDLFEPAFLGAPYPPGSGNGALFIQGGNPSLTPERAETKSGGFIIHPEILPGLNLEASWFDIDYTDRVVHPINPLSTALSNPIYAEFIIFSPTIAQQNAAFALVGQAVGTFPQGVPAPPLGPYDPARVVAIIDMRYRNTASQHIKGVDLTATYGFELFDGNFTASTNATWLETTQRLSASAPEQTLSGIVFYPPEFRGRIGGSWTDGELTLSATANYTAGVKNNLFPTNIKGDGMTTVDLVGDYVFATGPFGGELQVTLGVQNLFDEDPPFMRTLFPVFVNYDSTNYSATGRVVNLTVTQRF